ncbi:MAG: ArsA-related P-loop ATPase [Actinomycetota bacterium]
MTGLGGALRGARVVVVCGPGGVGKTTASAAIALRLAEHGRRVIVLTVDPARRLAGALGLPDIPGDPVPIRAGEGVRLEALQLDTKRTLDELVAEQARDDEQRDRILANRFYQRMADTLSGTNEYMAMEKLHALSAEDRHDTIVIDTPPTRSALSFLDAPRRLTDFLGGRFLRVLLAPSAVAGRGALRVTNLGAQAFGKVIRRVTGAELLADTAEFLSAFDGMYGGFKRRAARVTDLLREPSTRFVVVTSPEAQPLDEAAFFAERLRESSMPLGAVVANRCHGGRPRLPAGAERAAEALAGGDLERRVASAVLRTRLAWQLVDAREDDALAAFEAAHPGRPLVRVPELDGDVHDLEGLRRLGDRLFASSR